MVSISARLEGRGQYCVEERLGGEYLRCAGTVNKAAQGMRGGSNIGNGDEEKRQGESAGRTPCPSLSRCKADSTTWADARLKKRGVRDESGRRSVAQMDRLKVSPNHP